MNKSQTYKFLSRNRCNKGKREEGRRKPLCCCFMALHKPWLRLLLACNTSRPHVSKFPKGLLSRKGVRRCKAGSTFSLYKMPKIVRKKRQKVNAKDSERKSGNKEAASAVEGLEPPSKRRRTCLETSELFISERLTNLDVVRTLRSSSVPLHRKIEICSKYVNLQRSQAKHDSLLENCIPMPQFLLYLSEWIHSMLIISSREETIDCMFIRYDDSVLESGGLANLQPYLDVRYWDLLNWCLLSSHVHNNITIPSRLLHPITSLLSFAASVYSKERVKQLVSSTDLSIFELPRKIETDSLPSKSYIVGRNSKMTFVINLLQHLSQICGLIFSSNRKVFRPSLEDWVTLFLSVLKIVTLMNLKEVILPLQDLKDALYTNMTFVLQGFLSFITSYPNQRLIFQTIVERCLESALHVFNQLNLRFDKMVLAAGQQQLDVETQKLVTILEDILENGLFHASHVEGFSEVCSLTFNEVACQRSDDRLDLDKVEKKTIDLGIPLSYHRLFFDKIEQLRDASDYSVLQSIGWLFKAYARKLKIKQRIVEGGQALELSLTREEITVQHSQDLGREPGIIHLQSEKCAYPAEKSFIVFARLLMILKGEIERLIVFEKDLGVTTKLSKIQALMVAVNGLLAAAQSQHIYVPVDDASSKLHMKFLKEFHSTLFLAGGFITNLHFESLLPANASCSLNVNASYFHGQPRAMTSVLLAEVLKEVIHALDYMLELECRIFEDHLVGTWFLILLSVLLWYTLEDEGSKSIRIEESEKKAIYFGYHILHTFSDLRKVQMPLHALCVMFKFLLQPASLSSILFNFLHMEDSSEKQQSSVSISHFGLFQKAVQRVLHTNSFLHKISASVSDLPEGQAVEMIDMIALDMKDLLDVLDKLGKSPTQASGEFGLELTAVEVLGDIFTSSIEHINVTATNSFQVGTSVRNLVDLTVLRVLSSLLVVVDKTMEDGSAVHDNSKTFSSGNRQQNKESHETARRLKMEKSGKGTVPFSLFIMVLCLRIFVACRSLHRQCVIFMPPKKAKRANALVREPVLSGIDWSDIVRELSQEGFFSWINGSVVGVSDLWVFFKDAFGRCMKKVRSINHMMDQMRMLRLVDLNKYIQALECVTELIKAENVQLTMDDPLVGSALERFSERSQGTINDTGQLSLKMVNSLLLAYKGEAVLLVTSWMKDVLRGMKKLLCNNWEIGESFSPNLGSTKVLGSSIKGFLFEDPIPDGISSLNTCDGIDSLDVCSCCQMVMCDLNEKLSVLSRWYLLSNNTDIWSKHANHAGLEEYVQFLFQFYKWATRGKVAHFDGKTQVPFIRTCSPTCALQVVASPAGVLHNLSFYEDESLRQLIGTHFCKELKRVLQQCYKDPYFPGEVICDEQSTYLIEKMGEFIVTGAANEAKLAGVLKVKSTESVLKHFDTFSSLLHVFIILPRAYLLSNDLSICLNMILSLERLLLETMLCSHSDSSTSEEANPPVHMWKLLILLGQCRKACALIFLSAVDVNSIVNSSEDREIPSCNADVLRWFCISTRLATRCFDTFNHETDIPKGFSKEDFSKDALAFLVESTNQLIVNACGSIVLSNTNLILYQEVPERTEEYIEKTECFHSQQLQGSKKESKIGSSLANLTKVFLDEVLALEKSLKEELLDTCKQKEKSKSKLDNVDRLLAISSSPSVLCWYEAVVSAGFIHSFLSSAAIVFQDLDNYCHLHRTMNWRWVAQTISFLQELDSVLLKILQDIILTNYFDCSIDIDTIQRTSAVDKVEELLLDGHPTHSDKKLSAKGTNLLEIDMPLETISVNLSDEQLKLLGELFMSLAALVKLRSLLCSSYALGLAADKTKLEMPISLHVLLAVVYKVICSPSFWVQNGKVQSLTWLFGCVKCMESFGSLLPGIKPLLSSLAFSKLLNAHIHLLTTLLGTEHKSFNVLSSSSSNRIKKSETVDIDVQETENDSVTLHCLGQLINIVKRSFGALVRHAPRQHLILALQYIERAILNVWPSFEMVHGSMFSFGENGTVPETVAAGIDLLGITIDAVSGHQRLQLLVRHCPTLLGAILNLLAHLQGKAFLNLQQGNTFMKSKLSEIEACHVPQPNIVNLSSVVLRSLEIITRVASRSTIFPMSSRHVALSLHCPTTILRGFSQERMSLPRRSRTFSAERPYFVQVFKACCKLLCALVRHRRREAGCCVALLQESVNMLLYYLESEGDVPSTDGDVLECAHWVRRVYEEVGAHKDTLSRYCSQLVANYLLVLCANGPGAAGFHREVEKALHPGVFALMDACSTMDLQQLHVTLGEGPERNALVALRHDFEKHYKYRGKV